ncbi:MAG: acyl-CoA dehydrogenase, partial [Pseudomonadota bacterium]
MTVFAFVVLTIAAVFTAAFMRAPLIVWAGVTAVLAIIASFGLGSFGTVVAFVPAAVFAALSVPAIRLAVLTKPVFRVVKSILPPVSKTEKEALDAGTIGWDAELFSGNPDWGKLKSISPMELSEQERAFLDGPTEELCKMLDDWSVRHT